MCCRLNGRKRKIYGFVVVRWFFSAMINCCVHRCCVGCVVHNRKQPFIILFNFIGHDERLDTCVLSVSMTLRGELNEFLLLPSLDLEDGAPLESSE